MRLRPGWVREQTRVRFSGTTAVPLAADWRRGDGREMERRLAIALTLRAIPHEIG
jgi:hypothetical protein